MRILFIGDIFGQPGRSAVKHWLPDYRYRQQVDFVIGNGENAAGGKGITQPVADELFACGVDVLTGGNHSFHHHEAYDAFERDRRLLRPANLPPGAPGHGLGIYDSPVGARVAVLNLQGRAFMNSVDCPYRIGRELAEAALRETTILFVDFHAEATSEKIAMAWHLDGLATAVIGTHTHVPTADARVSGKGTAAMTDVGMTGPIESIIGVEPQIVLDQMIVQLPVRHRVAKGPARICALQVDCDDASGRATSVQALQTPEYPHGTAH